MWVCPKGCHENMKNDEAYTTTRLLHRKETLECHYVVDRKDVTGEFKREKLKEGEDAHFDAMRCAVCKEKVTWADRKDSKRNKYVHFCDCGYHTPVCTDAFPATIKCDRCGGVHKTTVFDKKKLGLMNSYVVIYMRSDFQDQQTSKEIDVHVRGDTTMETISVLTIFHAKETVPSVVKRILEIRRIRENW